MTQIPSGSLGPLSRASKFATVRRNEVSDGGHEASDGTMVPSYGSRSRRTSIVAPAFFLLVALIGSGAGQAHDASQLTEVSDQEFEQRCRLLFDGTVLAGWEGNAHWFRTAGNTIIAGTLEKPVPKNQFLCTTDTFADFDLRLEVRMRGENPNAGVQFRSRRPHTSDEVPRNEVIGYQADMGNAWGRSVWGALYDESRRRKMLAEPETPFPVKWQVAGSADAPSDAQRESAENAKSVRETEWVRMRIVCKGDQIEIFLNDHLTVRYTETDPEIPRVGMIGVQIHSGPPAEAEYRNIRILSL
ncbi:3-keto-disaccharide hydrolase [Allorhodopirellula heiligendammensis]|uniref:3-keto-alpha-glucoside-1,2-lyase/3-keto-2-hydroxy-glucal hydratase domain-containing protein n=1 Tax=Allorhodopirellula heiligendammensis TaxID=2714739 RepID=A0A5C6C420_9BACT|nr:DUF1080 domain-containing protein [Allorhodopirellula heiligendammensis]TWU19273.1 hypothetical protein Poly21_14450 [Allorhodopirellula heiligendammensis]